MSYATRVLIAVDQVVNAVIGGQPDETLSARAWRLREQSRTWGLARRVIDAAFSPFGRDHCRLSFESEQARRHLPGAYRPAE